MLELIAVTLGLQIVVPVTLLGWLAPGRPASTTDLIVRTITVGAYLVAVTLAGMWLVIPAFVPVIYGVLYVAAFSRCVGASRTTNRWPVRTGDRIRLAAHSVTMIGAAALAGYVIAARRAPDAPAIELAFPLAAGTYHVVNGGRSELVNAHIMTLVGERFRLWRGESYGVDLVKLSPFGTRARGFQPRDPAAYAIFGTAITAPCAGTIVVAVDQFVDLAPPRVDRDHLAGNHVILQCGDAWIVLGHMRAGSVCVEPGDRVEVGQPLGAVGNSGNTDEPHLHIHAQRPGTEDAPLSGDPLVVRFDGQYLARNSLFRVRR